MLTLVTPRARSGARIAALAAGVAALALTATMLAGREGDAVLPSLWRGGFETSDLRQWEHTWQGRDQSAQFQLTRSPSRDGGLAARFTVRPGDVYGASTGERSELALVHSAEGPGQQWYYAWSTLFPVGWEAPRSWGAIVQWHSRFPVPAAIAFDARGSTLKLQLFAGPISTSGLVTRTWQLLGGLSPGRWNDFVVYVRWSASDGAIQVWHRLAGQRAYRRVLAVTGVPTLQFDTTGVSSNYLKLGLYRNVDTATSVVVHDSMRRAPSLAEALAAGPDPVREGALRAMLRQDASVAGTEPASADPSDGHRKP